MGIEKYIAAASLGLFIMFVGEIITIYNFMIDSPIEIEPEPKILQYISIGVAPAVILAGTSFVMTKRYGSKPVGSMIVAGGAVLLVGMLVANILVNNIKESYLVQAVTITPSIFIAVSFPIIGIGFILLKIKKKRPKKEYF